LGGDGQEPIPCNGCSKPGKCNLKACYGIIFHAAVPILQNSQIDTVHKQNKATIIVLIPDDLWHGVPWMRLMAVLVQDIQLVSPRVIIYVL
jgi:hypothetical protein